MSGSGGGGGRERDVVDCEQLTIDTQISSPKEDVVNRINVGDTLQVELRVERGTAVVVVLRQGAIAGGITSPLVSRLRECIQQGFRYEARVLVKNDGQLRVRVSSV